MARSGYLQSIDGLRALAVLSVVAFHLNGSYLPGGFIGVDVFFVISGFVVARSVVDTKAKGFLEYLGWFYRRRILRIMPALVAFVLVGAIATALFIPTAPMTRFIEPTGIAALFGASNIFLFLKAGDYFATGSEFNPFTHTWSLAVEEQYYFLFPIFSYLLLVKRDVGPRLKAAVLVGLLGSVVMSLGAAAWFTRANPSLAFYMLPTRFWELGLGFFTFYAFRNRLVASPSQNLRTLSAVAALGAVMVLAFTLWTTDPVKFPFPGAVLPCLCTALLLLLFWHGGDTPVSRVFSWKPVVAIGKISYSLYLWHWGVIVLMRWTVGLDTLALQAVALVLMFALAILSYLLVEQPIRLSPIIRSFRPRRLGATFAAGLAIAITVNAGLWFAKPAISMSVTREASVWDPMAMPKDLPCNVSRVKQGFAGGELVIFRPTSCKAAQSTVWTMGDSHAGAYEHSYYRLASEGREVRLFTLGGCRLVGYAQDIVPTCAKFRKAAVKAISERLKPGEAVFAPGLYTPRYRDAWGAPPKSIDRRIDATLSYAEAVKPLVDKGARIVLEAPKPLSPTALYRCSDWFDRTNAYCQPGFDAARADIEAKRVEALRALTDVASHSSLIHVWDPLPLMCGPTTCTGLQDGRPLYYDTDHLSAFGNDLLYPSLRATIVGSQVVAEEGRHPDRPASQP